MPPALRKLVPCLGVAMTLAQAPRALAQPVPPAQPAQPPPVVVPPAQGPSEEDLARARELFREGSKLAEASDWEGARDRFERSLKIKHAAITLYNLGIAQQETGHLTAAMETFREFLLQPVEPATQTYVEPVRTALKQLEGRIPRVGVDLRPAGLRGVVLKVDGREVEASGPRAVDPGRHEVSVVAPGFGEVRQVVWLLDGTRTDSAITLAPTPPPAPPSVALPVALAATGLACAVAGAVLVGVGARHGLDAPLDSGSAKMVVAGAGVEGAGVVAMGAGFLVLLTRAQARPRKAAVTPWASGSVGGVQVRF